MTNDHSGDNAENDILSHDDHSGHGHDDPAHGDHSDHGHDDASSDAPTLVPTTGRQLLLPALILIIVAILLWGPVSGAFAPKPGSAGTSTSIAPTATAAPPSATPTTAPPAGTTTPVSALPPQASPPASEVAAPPNSAGTTATGVPSASDLATRTAVAQAGEQGIVTRAPVELQFAGAKFMVQAGSDVLPDWQPPENGGEAVWIRGTYANHVLYLPYNKDNAALFQGTKVGDLVTLVMDSGQTFQFTVTRSERAFNGPPANQDQFTTTTAMNQDHAGVTLFLVGDPAADRAVVQADFNGNIQ
jgi:hypothetical protein